MVSNRFSSALLTDLASLEPRKACKKMKDEDNDELIDDSAELIVVTFCVWTQEEAAPTLIVGSVGR